MSKESLSPEVEMALKRTSVQLRAQRLWRWLWWTRYLCRHCRTRFFTRHNALVVCPKCRPKYAVKLLSDPLCKHCFGRGYMGVDRATGLPAVCKCSAAQLTTLPLEKGVLRVI